MGMTRKHYEMIADTLAEQMHTAVSQDRQTLDLTLTVSALSIAFRIENPRFDVERFQKRVIEMYTLLQSMAVDQDTIDFLSKWLHKQTGLAAYRIDSNNYADGSSIKVNLLRFQQLVERQDERGAKIEAMRSTWSK